MTLDCDAEANPPPNYSWLLPNGTETVGPSLTLTNIELGDNGTYTCLVYNTYKNENHTANETLYLAVRKYDLVTIFMEIQRDSIFSIFLILYIDLDCFVLE